MKSIKLIIIDDERRIRNSIRNTLNLHYPKADIIAEAENAKDGIELIKKFQPDVVLLDINMPGISGFDMLKQLQPLPFKVIFITAFNEYAIQAFKFSAIDYLLKPVVPHELVEAMNKVETQIKTEDSSIKLDALLSNLKGLNKKTKKLILNSHDKTHLVKAEDIVRCEADGNYTNVVLSDKRTILISKQLKEFDEMLAPFGFFRSHNSHLVNLHFIDRLEKRDGGMLIMKDGSMVQVSARRHTDLIDAFNRISN